MTRAQLPGQGGNVNGRVMPTLTPILSVGEYGCACLDRFFKKKTKEEEITLFN
jgi:hypothetical protein